MTADFSKAPVCSYKRKKTWNISSMLYHLTYCGIMFAGGVDMSSALSLDVERLQSEDVSAAAVDPAALGIKADNTMMRILWYGFNQAAIAKCVFFDLAPFRVNETMAQAAPAAAPTPAPAAAPTPAPAATPTQTDLSLLLEDSKMTNAFIVGLKKAIMVDDKYTYPITDVNFKPPILYKPPTVKGGAPPPQDYDYLYQLPADIGTSGSRFTLFFGKAQGPPRKQDANGNFMLHPHEETEIDDHVNFHHNLVSAEHAAAANAAVDAINQGTPVATPPVATPPVAPAKTGFFGRMFNRSSTQAVATPPTPAVAPAKTGFFGSMFTRSSTTPVQINMTPQQLAQIQAAKAGLNKGGRRTRRLHKLKSRKHKKGKKVARVSRRKHHKSHTKRH